MKNKPKYKRVLLKISGEGLMQGGESLNRQNLERVARQVQFVRKMGVELCLVVGGGNFFRGAKNTLKDMDRVTGDYIGMMATVMNALALAEGAKQIAMHIAAASPKFKDIASVDADAVAHEKAIYAEQAKASGKPEAIIEKMVEGRIRKYYEEVVLMEQVYIMDPDKKVKDVLADLSKKVGTPVEIADFARFALGEGVEKKQEDFAAEVAAQMNK